MEEFACHEGLAYLVVLSGGSVVRRVVSIEVLAGGVVYGRVLPGGICVLMDKCCQEGCVPGRGVCPRRGVARRDLCAYGWVLLGGVCAYEGV